MPNDTINATAANQPAPIVKADDATPQRSAEESAFALIQRRALAICNSDLVPAQYRGRDKIGNTMIAMDLAHRLNVPVLAAMQNLHVIQGKPSWSSSFLIATVNASGKFSPLRYEFAGSPGKDDWACRAWAKDLATGERLEGTWITWIMAKKEGWATKPGSKWVTMPEQMFRYRAAAFWCRSYCPEISVGFMTVEEVADVTGGSVPDHDLPAHISPAGAASLEAVIGLQRSAEVVDAQPDDVVDESTGDAVALPTRSSAGCP